MAIDNFVPQWNMFKRQLMCPFSRDRQPMSPSMFETFSRGEWYFCLSGSSSLSHFNVVYLGTPVLLGILPTFLYASSLTAFLVVFTILFMKPSVLLAFTVMLCTVVPFQIVIYCYTNIPSTVYSL